MAAMSRSRQLSSWLISILFFQSQYIAGLSTYFEPSYLQLTLITTILREPEVKPFSYAFQALLFRVSCHILAHLTSTATRLNSLS